MRHKKLTAVIVAAGLAVAGAASAQGFDMAKAYVGGGLGNNSLSGFDDAMGFQVFAGYRLDDLLKVEPVGLAVEVGYMTTGDFDYTYPCLTGGWTMGTCKDSMDASGLWATAVADYALTPEFKVLGRIGLDFGDDDGLMIGGGVGYTVAPQFEVRGEYVMRDNIDSLQLNAVYSFK